MCLDNGNTMLAYSSLNQMTQKVKGSDPSKGRSLYLFFRQIAELKGKVKSLRGPRLTASTIYSSLQTSAVDPLPYEPKTPSP